MIGVAVGGLEMDDSYMHRKPVDFDELKDAKERSRQSDDIALRTGSIAREELSKINSAFSAFVKPGVFGQVRRKGADTVRQ